MILTNQEFRSKATYLKGKIKSISKTHVRLDFGYNEPIKIPLNKILDLIYCSKEMEEEIKKRLDNGLQDI